MARESIVTFEQAKKVIEAGYPTDLHDDQINYLVVLGAKALAYGKIQRTKRAERVKTALKYYDAAQAAGGSNVDAE